MKEITRKYTVATGISLLTIFVLFIGMAKYPNKITFELKKAPLAKSSVAKKVDSAVIKDSVAEKIAVPTNGPQRVLLIGDSQLEGLRKPVGDFCVANGHSLLASIIWYGSTTLSWGESDTLEQLIAKYKPSYVIIALGLNELFVNDLDNRAEKAQHILDILDTHGIGHFWIGPAAWKADKGITKVLADLNGTHFYPSHLLKLERGPDKRHPSKAAAKIWFKKVSPKLTDLTRPFDAPFVGPTIILSQGRK